MYVYTHHLEDVEASTLDSIAPLDFQELIQEREMIDRTEMELAEEEKRAQRQEEAFISSIIS